MKFDFRAILGRFRLGIGRRGGSIKATGREGERVAVGHLKKLGYRVLGINLRNRFGEVDLLAEAPDGRTIVVVEIKASQVANAAISGGRFRNPRPEVHVNVRKQRQLAALASQLARRYKLEDRPWRFDVIGVDLLADGPPVIRHHEAAFESNL